MVTKKKSPAKRAPAKRAPAKRAPAKRASNPPKKRATAARKRTPAKRTPAKRAPAKRRYTRKRNPPIAMTEILGSMVGGIAAALGANLLAGMAGGGVAMQRALRISVPVIAGLALSKMSSRGAQAASAGAYGAAGVEVLDVIASTVLRKQNPPIRILRKANPGPVRFANPFTPPAIGYPATKNGELRPGYLTPVPNPRGSFNPY